MQYSRRSISTTIDGKEPQMSRVQLALNVDDVDEAVTFYTKLFGVEPAKRRPGYANFAVEEPALKLVLIENRGRGGTLNHLGVEVATTDEVSEASRRLTTEGLATSEEQGVTCCHALQDKVWVKDPSGAPWEVYTVLADAPGTSIEGDAACCTEGAGASSGAGCC
jgi:catechol 2,3-dioxygenase-like lactoylglutathione lyase family enzyme